VFSVYVAYFKLLCSCKTPFVYFLDTKYDYVSNVVVSRLLRNKLISKFKYESDVSDCDDAAWIFKGLASSEKENGVGFVIGWHSGLHCWNVVLGKDGVYQLEPQNGKTVSSGYRPLLIII